MARYFMEFNDTADTSLCVGTFRSDATTPRRLKLYDLIFGSEAAPADNPYLWVVARTTGVPTGSAVTPEALDPADAASLFDAIENATTNPTVGNRVLSVPLNQRATFRWVAAPGSEIVVAATANAGLGVQVPTSTALAVTATAFVEEQ